MYLGKQTGFSSSLDRSRLWLWSGTCPWVGAGCFQLGLCQVSALVLPGALRPRSWLLALYHPDMVGTGSPVSVGTLPGGLFKKISLFLSLIVEP